MKGGRVTNHYARPGDQVTFRCLHCAEIYRLTVQPRRDLGRALRRLKENDDVPYAMALLHEAHEDLKRVASYLSDVETVAKEEHDDR